ncbi:hypothetical protein [Desulfofustis limnaeus]|jgi:hypothetical protein|nr:hypothetical protein [Desulfofustis limnaeus]MDX9894841.1 hypothetical protein [Desulfofustis sp.]
MLLFEMFLTRVNGSFRIIFLVAFWCCAPCFFSGCAGISKGITEAVIEGSSLEGNKKTCYVRGRPFPGLADFLAHQQEAGYVDDARRPTLKILMVHGIGSHIPGYSTRLAENLALNLGLTLVDEKNKRITILGQDDGKRELGILSLNRYRDRALQQEMIFAELTWDPIVAEEKAQLSFDNSGEYSFRRTFLNNSLKLFVNDTIPDVMMYNGTSRFPIQRAVGQAMCWLMSHDWQTLPDSGENYCDDRGVGGLSRIHDDFVFITHSLGSRITVDVLQLIASAVAVRAENDPDWGSIMNTLQEKEFTLMMLSNQLPLLQIGQSAPEVSGRIKELCEPQAPFADQRMFKTIRMVAFSDPNDLFSYAVPQSFLDEHVDSRLCPALTNVILNVAGVNKLFGGEFANPLTAHTEYDADPTVIDLLSHGIDTSEDNATKAGGCAWVETVSTTR